MPVRREALLWLEEAVRDLEDVDFALERGRWWRATFFAHQAVEKALKALWVHVMREPPPRTRILPELVPEGVDVGAGLDELYWLSKYYTISRYPDAAGGPPSILIVEWEARRAAEIARRVVERVRGMLRDP